MGSGNSKTNNQPVQSHVTSSSQIQEQNVPSGRYPQATTPRGHQETNSDMHSISKQATSSTHNHDALNKKKEIKINGPKGDSGNFNNSNPSNEKKETVDKKSQPEKVETNSSKPTSSSSKVESDARSAKEPSKTSVHDKEGGSVEPVAGIVDQAHGAQEKFNIQLRLSCELSKPEDVHKMANNDVIMLELHRAPAASLSLKALLQNLPNLQVVDISGNQLGPVGFRTMMYALCYNSTITLLNIANNQSDTDSSLSVGKMLAENVTLTCLDVSGNNLGKDYFSRCVGPALLSNNTLSVLRCESIGSTDMKVVLDNLVTNTCLTELSMSNNEIADCTELVTSISAWLKCEKCALENIALKSCGLRPNDLEILQDGIKQNISSLKSINISGNKVTSHQSLLDFLVISMCHSGLVEITAEDIQMDKKTEWKSDGVIKPERSSNLCSLNLSNCGLKDSHLASLSQYCPPGTLCHLTELVLNNNPQLTNEALNYVHTLLTVPDELCPLEKLSFGQNSAEGIPTLLSTGLFPNLHYLNIRRVKIKAPTVGTLGPMLQTDGIRTLVLDGIKLSGSNALQEMFATTAGCASMSLRALSLGGCQLTDADLKPLCTAVQQGLPIHMLKVSGNRLSDTFLFDLVDSLQAQPGHPLALIDLSNNKVKQDGAKKLADFIKDKKNRLNIQSLNVSNNSIESAGIEALVSSLGKLTTFQANNQQIHYQEEDMENIYNTLASTLGLKIKKDGDSIKPGCCTFPSLPATFHCKLVGLGGYTGDLGRMLDSAAICTDFQKQYTPHLTLQDILELAGSLKGQDSSCCTLSSEEWNNIISADKDAPSWLQLAEHRANAIYITGLPANLSMQKLEGFLEMDADCNVKDIYMCKDVLTRRNNGFAWALLSDKESVDKAVQFYRAGQAVVLGASFIISLLNVYVDDTASSQAQAKAREDMEQRVKSRKQADQEHRSLIEESYYTSQKRHAYRLAHPAYADGRIW